MVSHCQQAPCAYLLSNTEYVFHQILPFLSFPPTYPHLQWNHLRQLLLLFLVWLCLVSSSSFRVKVFPRITAELQENTPCKKFLLLLQQRASSHCCVCQNRHCQHCRGYCCGYLNESQFAVASVIIKIFNDDLSIVFNPSLPT